MAAAPGAGGILRMMWLLASSSPAAEDSELRVGADWCSRSSWVSGGVRSAGPRRRCARSGVGSSSVANHEVLLFPG